MSRKLVVEAVGTFFLVLTVGMVVLEPGAGAMAPLAIGSALMVMVYAGGHVSGGHYNPAVSLGVFLRGRLAAGEMVGYWAAQVVGAVLAVLVTKYLKPEAAVAAMTPAMGPAFVAEFIFTFALVFVVLNVATARATEGNSYFGLAIGFTVLVGAYSVGSISGGAFNPAVAVGITMLGLSATSFLWVFIVANLLGGAAAAFAFRSLGMAGEAANRQSDAETTRTRV